ncbi:DUF1127 domain-containing protein [Martelella mangrovi]|uniref:Uncharacterized protein YjiS (DUF1127 family) n=1 Tax=Martelella mangrovi TaxID=1397477 RepID=A0ABV2I8N4_9HYPH
MNLNSSSMDASKLSITVNEAEKYATYCTNAWQLHKNRTRPSAGSIVFSAQNQCSTNAAGKFEETPMHPFHFTMKWFSYRRTRAQLRNLTAAELKDIGLLPSDIDRVASRAFR